MSSCSACWSYSIPWDGMALRGWQRHLWLATSPETEEDLLNGHDFRGAKAFSSAHELPVVSSRSREGEGFQHLAGARPLQWIQGDCMHPAANPKLPGLPLLPGEHK